MFVGFDTDVSDESVDAFACQHCLHSPKIHLIFYTSKNP